MMKKRMFYGASNLIFEKAKVLRNNMTHAELVLWEYLRTHPLGFKFRRQHPLGIFIVDFYCHKLKLVIEVDGNIHDSEEAQNRDKEREVAIVRDGLKMMRFKNDEVLKESQIVFQKIELLLTELSKVP